MDSKNKNNGYEKRRKLERTLANLERRVFSLNYEGYFTRNLYRELKEVLNLHVGFRVHLDEDGTVTKKHCYGQLKSDEVKKFENAFHAGISTIRQNLKLNNNVSDDTLWKPQVNRQTRNGKAGSSIDLPLLVKKCDNEGCKAPYSIDPALNQCEICNKENLKYELRGIVRLISEKNEKELESFFDNGIVKKISSIFSGQEEPGCFLKYQDQDQGCGTCKYQEDCRPASTLAISPSETDRLIHPLDPDEVIHQLQDKCRQIMGRRYHFPVLLYDSSTRFLRYRAVDYLDLPEPLQVDGRIEDLAKNVANDFDQFANQFKINSKLKETLNCYLKSLVNVFKDKQTIKKSGCAIEKAARELLKQVIQRTNTGETKVVWDLWESRTVYPDPNAGTPSPSGVLNHAVGETLRSFLEWFFFTGTQDAVVITPLGYLGQRIGVMFTNVSKMANEADSDFKARMKKDSATFIRIAREFAPLLYHAIEYEMYRDALDALEQGTITDLPGTLLRVLSKGLNYVAGAFWTKDQIDANNLTSPQFLYAFNSIEETSKLDEIKKDRELFWKREFPNPLPASVDLKNILKEGNPRVFSCTNGPNGQEVYSKNGIDTRCRFLIPVRFHSRHPFDRKHLGKIQGVFDLFFDISPFILNRHKRDLARELTFVYTQTANAARQKQEVLRHGVRAAVSAIISRNHSHHIGSHVTPRSSVAKIQERLKDLCPCQSTADADNLIKVIDLLKTRLDTYIQKKADFSAEIGTEPLITTKSLSFFKEIFIPFIENTLLLDGIGANESVRYESSTKNRLKLHLLFNGTEVGARWTCSTKPADHKYQYNIYPYSGFCPDCQSPSELKQIQGGIKDMKIAVPGPLGEFAIYSILENFIRNAIKHNRSEPGGANGGRECLEVYIDVANLASDDPGRDNFYKVRIWDNLTNPCTCRKSGQDGQETVSLKNMLAELIERPIVDEEGKLKKGGWGIAEMKIMATLLSGSDDFLNMAANLQVGCRHGDGKDSLAYEFRVMRAKEIAVISDKEIEKENRAKLQENGVWYFSNLHDFSLHFREGKSIASFRFVIIHSDNLAKEEFTKTVLARLPGRVLRVGNQQTTSITGCSMFAKNSELDNAISGATSPEKIIHETWKHWISFLTKRHSSENPKLIVFLQQGENDPPTKNWKELEQKVEQDSMPFFLDVAHTNSWNPNGTDTNATILLYDRHAGVIQEMKEHCIKFYEAVDKGSSDFTSIFDDPGSPVTACEFAEAAMLNVLVIDERIAERAHDSMDMDDGLYDYIKDKRGDEPNSRITLAKFARIYLCTHLCINGKDKPLHEHVDGKQTSMKITLNLHKSKKELKINALNSFFNGKEEQIAYDIAIIHQGVLEGFVRNAIEPFSYDQFVAQLKTAIPLVVITSGRGIPHDVPVSAKFLPFSLLEDYVMKGGIAKYRLTRIVMDLIRRDVK